MVVFAPEVDRRLRERYELQRDMRSALAHGEFTVHYQPQAKIDGEVFGFEALMRVGIIRPAVSCPRARASRSPSRAA
jgi:sensor c-di-GMP phosphodiesterase-like protein